ncbi:MAG: hypothetical protein KC994_26755 [Candidatus Omnitrophica bacterium]|nr:hypothetical protein [Candidatus Omnitrophota bacterium]MCA9436350.1 hypothetical protein [Candidatus Omnitrophota bacterium]
MNDEPIICEVMEAYSHDAVDLAQEYCGETLDFSEESIETVEWCLGRFHESIPKGFFGNLFRRGPSTEEIEIVARVFGGYIGEVYRKHHGGEWILDDSIPGATGPIVTLHQSNGGKFFPTMKVYKRLTAGPEDNVWAYYRVLARELDKSGNEQG